MQRHNLDLERLSLLGERDTTTDHGRQDGIGTTVKVPAGHHGNPAEAPANSLPQLHPHAWGPHHVRLAVPSQLCLCSRVVSGEEGVSQECPQRTTQGAKHSPDKAGRMPAV